MEELMFLSHSVKDKKIANAIANVLRRISLNQIKIWFSSEESQFGGIRPGQRWLETIYENLKRSKAVITILTPNSINRPWIYFESGFGAGISQLEVIPICIGLDNEQISLPLSAYQIYNLSSYESAKVLFEKLLGLFNIYFDEEMCGKIINDSISYIYKELDSFENEQKDKKDDIQKLIDEVKLHMDANFNKMFKFSDHIYGFKDTYKVEILLDFKTKKVKDFIEITPEKTIQDITDDIYFMMSSIIEPYKYLVTWILRETHSKRNLVIREIAEYIPANLVFTRNSKWEMVLLTQPFVGTDSQDYYKKALY